MNAFNQFFETFGKVMVPILSFTVAEILLSVIWSFMIRPKLTSCRQLKANNNSGNNNPWAIITGCTDGIGLEFAKNLAKRGFNLCLISRNQSKLHSVKDKLLTEYHPCEKIETVAFDFSSTDYRVIEKMIKDLPSIDLLINNVGAAPGPRDPPIDFFCETEKHVYLKGLNINLISCVRMTSIVLPIMESQNSGTIVNLSSILGTKPSPLTSFYGGTKTFIDFFGRSLSLEYAEKQIRVTTLTPSFVRTKMTKMETNITIPSADEFVDSAMRMIHHESRSTGFWCHQILYRLGNAFSALSLQENWIDYLGLKAVADQMDTSKRMASLSFEPHPFEDDFLSTVIQRFGLLNRSIDMDKFID